MAYTNYICDVMAYLCLKETQLHSKYLVPIRMTKGPHILVSILHRQLYSKSKEGYQRFHFAAAPAYTIAAAVAQGWHAI